MAEAETTDAPKTSKKRNPIDGDAPPKTPAKPKLSKEEREAAKVASNTAAKNLDDSYKEKPDLVGDKPEEGGKRGRGRPAKEKPADPLKTEDGDNAYKDAGGRLLSFVERIERLNEEKKAISDDIKDVKLEVKGAGFDMKTVDRLVKVRAMQKADYDEQQTLFDLYANAIGLL